MKKSLTLILIISSYFSAFAQVSKEILYVGTYSVRGSEGIYSYEFERAKGTFKPVQAVKTLESPTFLEIHPSGKFLYTVNRGPVPDFKKFGSVSAYAIDGSSGQLTLVNEISSYGNSPCHVSIDQTGKLIFVSHYLGGTLVVFPISPDGSILPPSDSIVFKGSGIHKERQDRPHTHAATLSPDNRFVIVTDLGTDMIYSYSIDLAIGRLTPAKVPFVKVSPGSGPRHFTFDKKGKFAYLVEELSSTICTFSYNSKTGELKILHDKIATLPDENKTGNTSADIHIDPSGKHLLISNRGDNSLTIFSIEKNGSLTFKSKESSFGKVPRNFMIDPNNEFVFVAHQETDNVVSFYWNAEEGKLKPIESQLKVPSPVCLKMITLE
jgi:6-phosphogluconolactonase